MQVPNPPDNPRLRRLAELLVEYLGDGNLTWLLGAARAETMNRDGRCLQNVGWDSVQPVENSIAARPIKPLKQRKETPSDPVKDREMIEKGWIPLTFVHTLRQVPPLVQLASLEDAAFRIFSPIQLMQNVILQNLSPAVELSPDLMYMKKSSKWNLHDPMWWWNQLTMSPIQNSLLTFLGSEWILELAGFAPGTTADEISNFCKEQLQFIPVKILISDKKQWTTTGLSVHVYPPDTRDLVSSLVRLSSFRDGCIPFGSVSIIASPIHLGQGSTTLADKLHFIPNRILLFSYSLANGPVNESAMMQKIRSFVGVSKVVCFPMNNPRIGNLENGYGVMKLKQSVAGHFHRVMSRVFGKATKLDDTLGDVVLFPIEKETFLNVRLPGDMDERLWFSVFKALDDNRLKVQQTKKPPTIPKKSKKKGKKQEEVDTVLVQFMNHLGLEGREEDVDSFDTTNQYGKRGLSTPSPNPPLPVGGPLKEWPGLDDFGKCPDKPKVVQKRRRTDIDAVANLLQKMEVADKKSDSDSWEDVD